MEEAIDDLGFKPMETYIRRRKTMVAQYIVSQLIMNLCEVAESNKGEQVGMW